MSGRRASKRGVCPGENKRRQWRFQRAAGRSADTAPIWGLIGRRGSPESAPTSPSWSGQRCSSPSRAHTAVGGCDPRGRARPDHRAAAHEMPAWRARGGLRLEGWQSSASLLPHFEPASHFVSRPASACSSRQTPPFVCPSCVFQSTASAYPLLGRWKQPASRSGLAAATTGNTVSARGPTRTTLEGPRVCPAPGGVSQRWWRLHQQSLLSAESTTERSERKWQ
jgi:hypothetical protein